LLYLQVNPEGKAVNIRVLRSLAPDLDRNAIAAVEQWVFRPGMKNGQAVTVEAQIEVNFRLLEKPDGKAQL
jgi:protein TonB